MVNQLSEPWNAGDYPVNLGTITGYMFSGREATVSGYVNSKTVLDKIRKAFQYAQHNTEIREVFGGKEYAVDLTEQYHNIRKLTTDKEEPVDGWYVLRGFEYEPEAGYINYYRYTITLFYLPSTQVTGENVGTGDGTTKTFSLDHKPDVPMSEKAYLAGTAESRDNYTIDYDKGEITFDTAPGSGVAVTADYNYYS